MVPRKHDEFADQLRLLDARCVGGEAAAATLGGGDSARCVSVAGLTAVAGTDAGGLAVWDLSLSAPGVIGKPTKSAPGGEALTQAFRWCAAAVSQPSCPCCPVLRGAAPPHRCSCAETATPIWVALCPCCRAVQPGGSGACRTVSVADASAGHMVVVGGADGVLRSFRGAMSDCEVLRQAW